MKHLRVLIIILFLGLATTVQAAFIEKDFESGSGDHWITLDTKTNLEWLDVSLTQGLGYEQILHNEFVTANGFRLATISEFYQLCRNFNIDPNLGWLASNAPGAHNFINMIGSTESGGPYSNGNISQKASGYVQMHEGHATGYLGVMHLYFYGDTQIWEAKAYEFRNFTLNGGQSIGAYLVRENPVPIPGAIWLLGTGLLGLAGIRRKN